jgi:hypothetical protein
MSTSTAQAPTPGQPIPLLPHYYAEVVTIIYQG